MSKLCDRCGLRPHGRRGARTGLPLVTAMVLVLALLLATGSTYAAPKAGLTQFVATATGVSDISAGDYHGCAVLSDGTVNCWGYNAFGELGDGTTTTRWTPVAVSGITTATQVSGGYEHSCARLADGTVRCWGWNGDGQLGNGTLMSQLTPVEVSGITTATQVSAGRFHSCALLSDGTVRCWGDNISGQLGDGTTTDRLTPVAVPGITTATDVRVGQAHSCARLSDSTIKCWGLNSSGQLGDGTTTNRTTPISASGITTASQVAAGGSHTCAPLANGTAKCWGKNNYGQLGDGTTTNRTTPVSVSGMTTASQLAGGDFHSCAHLSGGTVKCWGLNSDGQLGDGTRTNRLTPTTVSGITNAAEVATGIFYSCARLSDGTVKCWGSDLEGYLGDGTLTYQPTAVAASGISTATQASGGYYHSCARLSDSTVACWGRNNFGQLGDGTNTDRSTAVAVSGITTATDVATGGSHSCARLSDGTIKCWGANGSGQLGDGTTTTRLSPVTVSGITTATDVSVGQSHSCARLSDSTIKCWGLNSSGQLGDGTTINRTTPVTVSGITTGAEVTAGSSHSCAPLSNGALRCWGYNFYGQLGDGSTTNSTIPVAVSGITTATQVSTGGNHTCAVLSGGTANCWGSNVHGQLGDGTSTWQTTPVAVSGIANATEIAAGNEHSCARLSDNTVKCWGWNSSGQLGNGTFTGSSTPVAVSGVTIAAQVTAGGSSSSIDGSHSCARLSDATVLCWGSAYHGQLGNGVLGYSLVPVSVAIGGDPPPPPPPPPLTITTTSLPGGAVNQPYSQTVTATDGTTPYGWVVSAGALPPGLSLTPTGTPSATISGTPTSAGSYNFTVRVTDSAATPATDTQELSITVAPPPPPPVSPPLLDDFNRAAENPVSQAGNWASVGINGGSGAPLSQNRLRSFPASAGGGYSYRVQPYLGGDMDASAAVPALPNTNHWLSVFVCLQDIGTTGWDGYELRAKRISGPDLWEIRRIDNGQATVLGSTNLDIASNGAMLLRRIGSDVQFWWEPSGGNWTQKLSVTDSTYLWGHIGAGGYSSGALDNFSGGSLLSLLNQYAPELRYDTTEGYRADSAAEITDSYVPGDHTNDLLDAESNVLAAADPDVPSQAWPTRLSLDYLATYEGAETTDRLREAGTYQADANRLHAMPQYGDKMYGRTSTYNGLTVLQYWFFYYYNSKDFAFGLGLHQGDWEMVTILLNGNGTQVGATYAQHGYGELCAWEQMEKATDGRPVVYVAEGSHASYFHASSQGGYTVYWQEVPVGTDNTDGAGETVTPMAIDITTVPAWLAWPGRWGADDGVVESPFGPSYQGFKWDNPALWALDVGQIPCRSGSASFLEAGGPTTARVVGQGVPPAPVVSARINKRRAIIDYRFATFPTQRSRRPWMLVTSVLPSDPRYAQYTVRTRISARSGRIVHRLGPGPGPYKLRVATLSALGTRSKVLTMPLK